MANQFELTKRQLILEMLDKSAEKSLTELATILGKDKSNVRKVVKDLEYEGLVKTIRKKPPGSRYIEVYISRIPGGISVQILNQQLIDLKSRLEVKIITLDSRLKAVESKLQDLQANPTEVS